MQGCSGRRAGAFTSPHRSLIPGSHATITLIKYYLIQLVTRHYRLRALLRSPAVEREAHECLPPRCTCRYKKKRPQSGRANGFPTRGRQYLQARAAYRCAACHWRSAAVEAVGKSESLCQDATLKCAASPPGACDTPDHCRRHGSLRRVRQPASYGGYLRDLCTPPLLFARPTLK